MRRGVGGFRVAKHLHLPVTHDKQAETAGRERDDALIGEWAERFRDGLNRHRVVLHSAAGELDVAVDRDCASDPTQREAVVRIRRFPRLGYGKLADWVYDSSDAILAATSRSHVGYPDDTVGLYGKRSRGLAIRDVAHAVDLDWRPIRFRQNILALFRIPASDPYRAAKLHEHQYSGFDDNETIGIIEGYGIPQSPLRREQAHRSADRDTVQWDTPQRHVRVNRAGQYLP